MDLMGTLTQTQTVTTQTDIHKTVTTQTDKKQTRQEIDRTLCRQDIMQTDKQQTRQLIDRQEIDKTTYRQTTYRQKTFSVSSARTSDLDKLSDSNIKFKHKNH